MISSFACQGRIHRRRPRFPTRTHLRCASQDGFARVWWLNHTFLIFAMNFCRLNVLKFDPSNHCVDPQNPALVNTDIAGMPTAVHHGASVLKIFIGFFFKQRIPVLPWVLPWVSSLKSSNFGCFGGTPSLGNLHMVSWYGFDLSPEASLSLFRCRGEFL